MNDSQRVSVASSEIHQMADSVVSSMNFWLAVAQSQSLLNRKFNVRRHFQEWLMLLTVRVKKFVGCNDETAADCSVFACLLCDAVACG